MSNFWRLAGLNYVQYSRICAQAVRRGLKADAKTEALKRDTSKIKMTLWKDGKSTAVKK